MYVDNPSEQQPLEVIVTIVEDRKSQMQEIIIQLEAKGLKVIQTMENIGQIAGTVPPNEFEQLGKVVGVVAVEPSGEVQILPLILRFNSINDS